MDPVQAPNEDLPVCRRCQTKLHTDEGRGGNTSIAYGNRDWHCVWKSSQVFSNPAKSGGYKKEVGPISLRPLLPRVRGEDYGVSKLPYCSGSWISLRVYIGMLNYVPHRQTHTRRKTGPKTYKSKTIPVLQNTFFSLQQGRGEIQSNFEYRLDEKYVAIDPFFHPSYSPSPPSIIPCNIRRLVYLFTIQPKCY